MQRVFFAIVLMTMLKGIASEVVFPEKYDWMDKAIEQSFHRFTEGISLSSISATKKRAGRLSHIKVIDNQVYLVSGARNQAFTMCQKLAEKYTLPDLDFLYFAYDGLVRRIKGDAPILTSAKKTRVVQGIPFIAFYDRNEWIEEYVKIMDEEGLGLWEERIPQLSWRGAPNNKQRIAFVTKLGVQYPELIDAKFVIRRKSHMGVFRDAPQSGRVSVRDLMKYKYQIDIDGNHATFWGFMWKLYSDALVFKPDSDTVRWFYPALVPYEHYIPVKADFSDLMEKFTYYREHDEEARRIAKNGRKFAQEVLSDESVEVFCYKTLLKYASLQDFDPTL